MFSPPQVALGCGTVGFDRDIFGGSPSLKHLVDTCMINGQGGSDTPLSTELLFAAGCTTVSWLVMYAANFLKIHARVVGPPWSATAEAFAARVRLGFGV